MAPTALFDKSFLQSLSVDESVVFDNFFSTIICPVFYIETLADLEKAVREGRTPEQEVGIIANKVPEMNVAPYMHHGNLAIRNLLGTTVPMDGRMLLAGRAVKKEGHIGVIHDPPPEAEAFQRWQARAFLDVERRFAKKWREALNGIDLLALASGVRALGVTPQTCTSLQDAKEICDRVIANNKVPDLIKLATMVLNVDARIEQRALEGWKASNQRSFTDYAPYAAHVVAVEVFFQIALGANHITTTRVSNRTDIAYLFYLPFCNVFVSSDRLHQRCAPLFLRNNQTFVWGQELKADLQRLVTQYKALPEFEREKGIRTFAPKPPRDDKNGLLGNLWDRHVGSWREDPKPIDPDLLERLGPALRELIEQFASAPEADRSEIADDLSNVGMIEVNTVVRPQKGSFWQGPKRLAD